MELKIFKKKNVSFLEMLEFLIKFIFYFDTSELFLKEKKNNKLFRKNKNSTLSLFDYCFYSNSEIDKLLYILNCQSGGASNAASSAGTSAVSSASSADSKSSNEKTEPPKNPEKSEGGNNGEKGDGDKEGSGENGEKKKNDEEKQQDLSQFVEEIKDSIGKGVIYIKTKVMAIISLIVYASIYPAIPFFLVMASLYGTLKYFMYKFRNF